MVRRLQKMICAVMVMALLLTAMAPAMASSYSAKLTSSAKVYKHQSTSSASTTLKRGTKVTVTSFSGSWAKIKLDGKTGYTKLKNIELTSGLTAYASESTHIYKCASSSSSNLATLSVNSKVYIIGASGSYYKVKNSSRSVTGYVRKSSLSKSKTKMVQAKASSASSWKSKVVTMDWFHGGSSVLKKGGYAYIYDIRTGLKVKIKRMGGHYHADVEPATKADTEKLLKIAGGEFSWDSHAVILIKDGKYIACAINTMPHGDETIDDNNYDGQFCLHMTNSITHCSEKVNSNHASAIQKAYNWAH